MFFYDIRKVPRGLCQDSRAASGSEKLPEGDFVDRAQHLFIRPTPPFFVVICPDLRSPDPCHRRRLVTEGGFRELLIVIRPALLLGYMDAN